MRMVPDDQVRSRRRDLGSLLLLPVIQLIGSLRSPVDVHDDEIAVRLCRRYHLQEFIDLQAPEHPRRCLRCSLCIRRECPLDLGGGDEGDLLSICDKGYRFHRLIEIPSRSHIGHSDGFQGIQGICQGHFAIIVGVVVRQGHEIRSHVKEPGRVLRIRTECKFLSRCRRSARRIREFVVYHENIGAPHDG